jgi:tetratricopeptide (TPR) repeat protein
MAAVVAAALVVALIAVAGSVGWIASERAAREAALEAEVDRAVDEAGKLIASGKWPEATERVQRARAVLRAAGRRQVPERLEEVDRDLAMTQRLEEIYGRPRNNDFFTGKDQDSQYAEAFKQYGIDVAVLPVAEASRRIRARNIRAQLVLALDLWANMRYRAGVPVGDWQELLKIAGAADDDPWRCRLREICRGADRSKDRETVAALVAAADLTRMPPASLYLLARVCRAYLQDTEMALAVLRQAQQRYPGDLWLNFTLASECMDAQPPQHDEAIRYYSVALALRPNNPLFLWLIGRARLHKGDYSGAIAALSQAIAIKPDYADALSSRSAGYLKTGAPKQALADASRAVELAPESSEARRLRGDVYGSLQQWPKAVADYSAALKLEPGDFMSRDHRGNARVHLHDWDGALADFSEALRLDPKWPFIWMRHGEILVERGQWAAARADFQKALELAPEDTMVWFFNACLDVRCADNEAYRKRSKRMYDRFGHSKNFGDIAVLAHVWSLAAQANGDSSHVRELAQLRVELADLTNRDDPAYRALSRHVLGLAYFRIGEYDKAIALLDEFLQTKHHSWQDASDFLVLAMAHYRLSHVAKARQWLAKAARQIDQEAKLAPKGGSTPPGRLWWEWLCLQMLRREAEALLAAGVFAPTVPDL